MEPAGPLTDDEFDALLPDALWQAARVHFTPVEVARHAARMLAPAPGGQVLDVGAGVGKFCIAAALEAPAARFVGAEQRPHLVELARTLARRLGAANTEFVPGDAFDLDWRRFDGVYLFNPFGEDAHGRAPALDDTVRRDPDRFFASVRVAQNRLGELRAGARVVTFHGFGRRMPSGFDQVERCEHTGGPLELWVRR